MNETVLNTILDIKKNTLINNNIVLRADDPRSLRIGFVCINTGKYWYFNVSTLKEIII